MLIPLMIKFTGGRWLALFAVVMMAATSATVPSRVDGAYAAALFIILCRLAFVVLWCAVGELGMMPLQTTVTAHIAASWGASPSHPGLRHSLLYADRCACFRLLDIMFDAVAQEVGRRDHLDMRHHPGSAAVGGCRRTVVTPDCWCVLAAHHVPGRMPRRR